MSQQEEIVQEAVAVAPPPRNEEAGAETCPICTDVIQATYTAACTHKFCLECVLAWSNSLNVTRNPTTCPMCRGTMDRQEILRLHSAQFREADNNRMLSIEDFARLRGVHLRDYGYQLRLSQPDWINSLNSVLSLQVRNLPSLQLSTNERSFLKIGTKSIIFETPELRCIYHNGSEQYHTGPSLLAISPGNDLSVFEELDNIFKAKFIVDASASASYEGLVKKPRNDSPNAVMNVSFKLPKVVGNNGESQQSAPVIFDYNRNRVQDDILTNKSKYKCCLIVKITFNKISSINKIYPIMSIIQLKCEKIVPSYAFLE